VGQFMTVMDAMHAWPQARQLPWPCELGKQDTRRGPRTWEWGGTPASPMTLPLLWLAPEEYNDFPPPFRAGKFNRMSLSDTVGGNASPDHPIQYVSGQVALLYAGLCGCRLPTPAEWQMAYATFEKSVSLDGWNLRDQTWEAQRRYVATGGGSRWPDEGIFPGAMSVSAAGRTATSRPGNDGALYFQPVNATRGNVFHHLVGNVAQFVCDVSDSDQLGATRTTAVGIRQFIEQFPKCLYVIGGSALSAPELPLDKAQPVTHTEEAYADVGFRLAFTAPSRTLAEKVKWAIGDPPYFWPKPVTAAVDRR
jgi:formylglycine-generating enzyme required for sulfatase activity